MFRTIIFSFLCSLIISACNAMENNAPPAQSQSKLFITKTVLATLHENPLETRKVKVQIQVAAPAEATSLEERNAYYTSRKEAIIAHLQQLLIAYENETKKQMVGNHFVTLSPPNLFLIPMKIHLIFVRVGRHMHSLAR